MFPSRSHDGYGRGVVSIADEWIETSDILDALNAALRAPGYEPPMLPTAAIRALELSRKPDVDLREIVALIETDPLIAGKVLRVAQSPVFARGAPLRSLRDGVMRLGLETLLQIFLEVSISGKVFRAPGYDGPMERLRRHSSATAQCARVFCKAIGVADEYAFLCGLLHDVGVAACMIVLASRPRGEHVPSFEEAWSAIEQAHETASELLGTAWRLPDHVRFVLGSHERVVVDGKVDPLAASVHVASWIATRMGFGLIADESPRPPERILNALRVTPETLQQIVNACKPTLARLG